MSMPNSILEGRILTRAATRRNRKCLRTDGGLERHGRSGVHFINKSRARGENARLFTPIRPMLGGGAPSPPPRLGPFW